MTRYNRNKYEIRMCDGKLKDFLTYLEQQISHIQGLINRLDGDLACDTYTYVELRTKLSILTDVRDTILDIIR